MAEPSDIQTGLLGDMRRLVHFRDLLHHVGTLLYRRSLRYTLLSAGISLVGLAGRAVGIGGLTVTQAVALPLLVGLSAVTCGLAMRLIPALISSRQLNIAQANDLNLMEDHRKSLQDRHLEILWQRVFQYEWPFRQVRADPDETPRQAFFRLAGYALAHPLPQARQRCQVGMDLRYLEDWRDGAWFDTSDTKLAQQYAGDAVLVRIRGMVPRSLGHAIRSLPARAGNRLWFSLATRAAAVETAVGVWTLNRRFQTDLFNSQVLLWPGEEDQPWLTELDGARREVLARRRIFLQRVFGPSAASTRVMIRRMFGQELRDALWLRCGFDPEYCTGKLQHNLRADLAEAGWSQRRIDAHSLRARRLGRALETFEQFCRTHRPDLLGEAAAEAWRAAGILLHLRPRLVRALAVGRVPDRQDPTGKRLAGIASEALANRRTYSRMLCCLRLHHELTRMQILGYETLIQNLRETLHD